MEISEFTFRILVIGLPGILCYFLLGRLVRWRHKDTALTIMCIFLLGCLSYFVYSLYFLFVAFCYGRPLELKPVQELFTAGPITSGGHILGACIASFYLSLLLSYAHTKKLFNQVAQKLRATNRYGDEDVWDHFHNSPLSERHNGWMYFRDYKQGLLYYGFISTWSETEDIREVVLIDADVFDNKDGSYLYSAEKLYIARQPEDLSVEVSIHRNFDEQKTKPESEPTSKVSPSTASTDRR